MKIKVEPKDGVVRGSESHTIAAVPRPAPGPILYLEGRKNKKRNMLCLSVSLRALSYTPAEANSTSSVYCYYCRVSLWRLLLKLYGFPLYFLIYLFVYNTCMYVYYTRGTSGSDSQTPHYPIPLIRRGTKNDQAE